MITFLEILSEMKNKEEILLEKTLLFEYEVYKKIPGTKNSYRQDPSKTTTQTLKHSHIYAKQKGRGKQLYSINIDGTGHDGSSGIEIPTSHAEYFRSVGYKISKDNIIESIDLGIISNSSFNLILIEN